MSNAPSGITQIDRSLAKVLAGHVVDEHFDPDKNPDIEELHDQVMAAAARWLRS